MFRWANVLVSKGCVLYICVLLVCLGCVLVDGQWPPLMMRPMDTPTSAVAVAT